METLSAILDEAPVGALPLSRVLRKLRKAGEAVPGSEGWILQRIKERPSRFRIIPDRLGPWNLWPEPLPAADGLTRINGPGGDPWVVALSGPRRAEGWEDRFVQKLKESLQAWARCVDVGSQVAIARWIGANREGEIAVGRTFTNRGRRF
jgi:hypothetical protein